MNKMDVTVYMRSPAFYDTVAVYSCNGNDKVKDICKQLRLEGPYRAQINGNILYDMQNLRLCDVQDDNRVFITPLLRMGTVWGLDHDGVYRYKHEYV